MKENSDLPSTQNKIRVPGADDPKNALEVFKTQFENFSIFYLQMDFKLNLFRIFIF